MAWLQVRWMCGVQNSLKAELCALIAGADGNWLSVSCTIDADGAG